MKPRKITILVMLLGLLLLASAVGVAQTPSQGDQKKKSDACCAMHKKDMNHADDHECCGCCADSCDMDMKADGTMKHDMKDHKGDCCKAKSKDAKDKNKQ